MHLISPDIAIQLATDHHREDLARASRRRPRLRRRPPLVPTSHVPFDAA